MASPRNHCHWRNHLHFTDYVIGFVLGITYKRIPDDITNYFRRCWPCMLLPRQMANKVSIAIRKGTKYYPKILENQSASVLGTLCALQVISLEGKWDGDGKDTKRLSATIRSMRSDQWSCLICESEPVWKMAWKETIARMHQFFKHKESLATSLWKGIWELERERQ